MNDYIKLQSEMSELISYLRNSSDDTKRFIDTLEQVNKILSAIDIIIAISN